MKLSTSDGWMKVKNAVGSALSLPARAVQKVRGVVADTRRGKALYDRGYGKYYDWTMTVAKKGVKNPDRH